MRAKMLFLPDAGHPEWARAVRDTALELRVVQCETLEQAEAEIEDAVAAFGTVPPALLAKAGRLRWLQAPQAGPPAGWYYPELVEHPVVVTNMRGIFNEHLGAHILAFVLAFARGLHVYLPQQRRRTWRPGVPPVHLPGTTALILGVGGIGSETARLLAPFGIRVLAVDPRQQEAPDGVAELHPPDALDELLPRADWVICTAPETPHTQGLFHRERLRRMKPTAFLINISRGALVPLDDLVQALRKREIGGAALDVFETEPLPPDHPLWTMPNVMITPHVGGEGPFLDERRCEILVENARRFMAGAPLLNVVDKADWF